jgi:hypothetical protein
MTKSYQTIKRHKDRSNTEFRIGDSHLKSNIYFPSAPHLKVSQHEISHTPKTDARNNSKLSISCTKDPVKIVKKKIPYFQGRKIPDSSHPAD